MVEIRVESWTPAPIELTWSVLMNHAEMARWAPVRSSRVERPGETHPDGVGAIRVLKVPPLTVREEVTEVDDRHRLAYKVLSGLPVHDYQGQTLLTSRDGGTDIVWTVSLRPRLPGVAFIVRRSVKGLVQGLADESTARSSAPESF